jgi:WD40 repeat protein
MRPESSVEVWKIGAPDDPIVLKGHTKDVDCAAFSPDGTRMVTGSSDRTARIWESTTGRQLSVLQGHNDQVSAVAFTHDGTRVVTGAWDGTVRMWDARFGREVLLLHVDQRWVFAAAMSTDDSCLVVGAETDRVHSWDTISASVRYKLTKLPLAIELRNETGTNDMRGGTGVRRGRTYLLSVR